MDLETIKELMVAMEEQKISKLIFKEKEGDELELEREKKFQVEAISKGEGPLAKGTPDRDFSLEEKTEESPLDTDPGSYITSPMVGTFYKGPSPDDPPFVKVGEAVEEETVVCIIEAMKVMNEVKAGKKGTITEVFPDNGHPVEFGTQLFCLSEG